MQEIPANHNGEKQDKQHRNSNAKNTIELQANVPQAINSAFKKYEECNYENILQEIHEQDGNNPSGEAKIPKDIKDANLVKLHQCMDKHLDMYASHMQCALRTNRLDDYITMFSKSIESAVVEFKGDMTPADIHKFNGRSKINVVKKSNVQHTKYDNEFAEAHSPNTSKENKDLKLYRQLCNINSCHKKRTHDKDDVVKRARPAHEILGNAKKFITNVGNEEEFDDIKQHIIDGMQTMEFNFFKIELAAQKLYKKYKQAKGKEISKQRINRIKDLEKASNRKLITKAIKGLKPAHMTCLTRDIDMGISKPKGSLSNNDEEIDGILNRVWKNITHGKNKAVSYTHLTLPTKRIV